MWERIPSLKMYFGNPNIYNFIFNFCFLKFLNVICCNYKKINSEIDEITFYNGPQKYKLRFGSVEVGIDKTILQIMCGEKDVTEEIIEYMGPYKNFYGIPTTPKMLGYDSLSFEFLDIDDLHFNEDDQIVFGE